LQTDLIIRAFPTDNCRSVTRIFLLISRRQDYGLTGGFTRINTDIKIRVFRVFRGHISFLTFKQSLTKTQLFVLLVLFVAKNPCLQWRRPLPLFAGFPFTFAPLSYTLYKAEIYYFIIYVKLDLKLNRYRIYITSLLIQISFYQIPSILFRIYFC